MRQNPINLFARIVNRILINAEFEIALGFSPLPRWLGFAPGRNSEISHTHSHIAPHSLTHARAPTFTHSWDYLITTHSHSVPCEANQTKQNSREIVNLQNTEINNNVKMANAIFLDSKTE